jgi:NADH:ubiquinone oxidoreductase subunit 6 (subunit J)
MSPPPPDSFGGATAVGDAIFPDLANSTQHFILPFELVSVLIIAAMIGAIVLARPEPGRGARPERKDPA